MFVWLWLVFVGIALVLVIIGLIKSTESAQAIIGFLFLFLLSFTVMGNSLEYQTGELTNLSYNYLSDNVTIDYVIENSTYTYTYYDDTTGIFNTHRFGYFMAIASAIGLIGTLASLTINWRKPTQ